MLFECGVVAIDFVDGQFFIILARHENFKL